MTALAKMAGGNDAFEAALADQYDRILATLANKLETDVDELKAHQIPLALAIIQDKRAALRGKPSSFTATLTLKGEVGPEQIRARLTGKIVEPTRKELPSETVVETASQSVSPPRQTRQNLPSALVELPDPRPDCTPRATIDCQSIGDTSQTIDMQ
jgi:hypothetical protein